MKVKTIENYISRWIDDLTEILELRGHAIGIRVRNRKKGDDYSGRTYTLRSLSKASIIEIIAEEHDSKYDVLSTLIHELLHVRFDVFRGRIKHYPKSRLRTFYKHEEIFIRQLERIYFKVMKGKFL